MQQYTNELTPEFIHNHQLTRARQIAELPEEFRATQEEQNSRKIIAIYRHACEGALTRDGGVLQESPDSHSRMQFSDGTSRRYSLAGDKVVYPDGSTAKIISGTGKYFRHNGKSMALVGSHLDNGDIIISTPQNARLLLEFEDSPYGHDFLNPEA